MPRRRVVPSLKVDLGPLGGSWLPAQRRRAENENPSPRPRLSVFGFRASQQKKRAKTNKSSMHDPRLIKTILNKQSNVKKAQRRKEPVLS